MKLTIETIRRLIKEELQKIHEEEEESLLPKAIGVMKTPGRWSQSMDLREALNEKEQEEFMQAAAQYTMDKLEELAGKIKIYLEKGFDAHKFEFKDITSGDPKYQIEFKLRYYNSNTKYEFNKSYVRLRKEDGMFDLDLYISPESRPEEYEEDYRKRYEQDGLGLEKVINMLITIYTKGGAKK